MKKKTPQQELEQLRFQIRQSIGQWRYIKEHGCQDPFWTDGVNMNLVRNHIIYDKRQMEEICRGNVYSTRKSNENQQKCNICEHE